MHDSLQVSQTPSVPNTDERRWKTEPPNWCRIRSRNKQGHANVCAPYCACSSGSPYLSSHLCVHLSFTLIMGRITAVCVQTVRKHIHSCQGNLFILYVVCSHRASCVSLHKSAVRHANVL